MESLLKSSAAPVLSGSRAAALTHTTLYSVFSAAAENVAIYKKESSESSQYSVILDETVHPDHLITNHTAGNAQYCVF